VIFVVEVPNRADPSAWFAYDLEDLLRKIEHRSPGAMDGLAAGAATADAVAKESAPQCRIFWTEAEATAAFERASDPLWQGAGWRARLALRDQLVALEVLADDL
jgi:hypothetical protein